MARVFRARDEKLDRVVALKVLVPAPADGEFRERFIRESRAASLVDHPNIIPIYAAGEDAGVLYLAMRHVPGGDLHSLVDREGPLPPERVVTLTAPVASALDAAHRAGIVHRDVKPANVLLDRSPGRPDHPYLSDFGLAKRDATTPLTNVGEFVGTAGFAAPEQIDGRPAGPESEQYALACVVFTLLTKRMPFRSRSPEAVLWAQMSQPPPRVTPVRPELPAGVDAVIARALAKNPHDRFADCTAFIDALARVLADEPLPGNADPAHAPADAAPQTHRAGPAPDARNDWPAHQGVTQVRRARHARDVPSVRIEPPGASLPGLDVVTGPGNGRVRVLRVAVVAAVVVVVAAALRGTILCPRRASRSRRRPWPSAPTAATWPSATATASPRSGT